MEVASHLRDIPDFPKPGIVFKDISPLLADPDAFQNAINAMAEPFQQHSVSKVAGIEARGFLFGPGVAARLGVGFVPIRKPGKLPAQTMSVPYELEYGTDTMEMHADAVCSRDRVLLVDDVLATGGTLGAATALIRRAGATPVGATILVELAFLGGRGSLGEIDVHSLHEVL